MLGEVRKKDKKNNTPLIDKAPLITPPLALPLRFPLGIPRIIPLPPAGPPRIRAPIGRPNLAWMLLFPRRCFRLYRELFMVQLDQRKVRKKKNWLLILETSI